MVLSEKSSKGDFLQYNQYVKNKLTFRIDEKVSNLNLNQGRNTVIHTLTHRLGQDSGGIGLPPATHQARNRQT